MSDLEDRFEETEGEFDLNEFIDKYDMLIATPTFVVTNLIVSSFLLGILIGLAELISNDILTQLSQIIGISIYFIINFALLDYFYSILDKYGTLKSFLYIISVSTIGVPLVFVFLPISFSVLAVRKIREYL